MRRMRWTAVGAFVTAALLLLLDVQEQLTSSLWVVEAYNPSFAVNGRRHASATAASLLSSSSSSYQADKMAAALRRETIRMPTNTPMVPYKPPNSDYAQFIDIEAAMYRDRTIMISEFIDEAMANKIISILLYLRNEGPTKPISMYLNVPGAQLRPALAVYDLMLNTRQRCNIETVNLALCAGMGAILCSAGTKGLRCAMPNARFLLQRTGMDQVFRGQATDIALEVKNVKTWNDRMENELSLLTGQSLERIQKDLKRDFYLSSDEAVQYGLIDQVLLPSLRKRAARGKDVNLGVFEGDDDQRYQNQGNNRGGWGSRSTTTTNGDADNRRKKSDDDDDDNGEPKVQM